MQLGFNATGWQRCNLNRTACVCCLLACLGGAHAAGDQPAILESAHSVHELPADLAARGIPVKLKGVVTYTVPRWQGYFLEDETGGVYCESSALEERPEIGELVEIEGKCNSGHDRPYVIALTPTRLGRPGLPQRSEAPLLQTASGELDARLVVVRGHLAYFPGELAPYSLHLQTREGSLDVRFDGLSREAAADLIFAEVKVTGTMGSRSSPDHGTSTPLLLVPGLEQVEVVRGSKAVLEQLPPLTPEALLAMGPRDLPVLAKTSGTLNALRPEGLWVEDNGHSLLVQVAGETGQLLPGARLTAVGFPQSDCGRMGLASSRIVATTGGPALPPLSVRPGDLTRSNLHGRLIRTRGRFLHKVVESQSDLLVLTGGDQGFVAELAQEAHGSQCVDFTGGCELEVVGVLRLDVEGEGRPPSPRILLRGPGDLKLASRAPWSMELTLAVVTTLSGGLALGLVALLASHARLRHTQRRLNDVDNDLKALNQDLERRIKKRTTLLEEMNRRLSKEVLVRRVAEEALASNEARLKAAQHLAKIGSFQWDPACDRVTWSDELYRICGEDPATYRVSYTSYLEHLHPDDRERVAEHVTRALQDGRGYALDYRIKRRDGQERWVSAVGRVVAGAGGNVIRLEGTCQDITARRQVERALQDTEERFSRAIEVSPALTSLSTFPDGEFLLVNEAFRALLGYTDADLKGKSSPEIGIWAIPQQRESLLALLATGGTVTSVECQLRGKSGQIHTVLGSMAKLDVGGRPCLLSIAYDITERKRTENALRALARCGTLPASEEIFGALALELAALFQTRFAVVAELVPGRRDMVRTLGAFADGQVIPNFDKELPGSPCEQVLETGWASLVAGVQERYPHDKLMGRLGIESYLGVALRDSSNRVLGLLAVLHDKPLHRTPNEEPILQLFAERVGVELERRSSLAALRAAEARFRSAIENSHECFLLSDDHGVCTYASPAALAITGYSPRQLLGQWWGFLVAPEDRGGFDLMIQELLLERGARRSRELRLNHRDGTLRWIHLVVANHLQDPNLSAIVSSFREITEKKALEESLRDLSAHVLRLQDEERSRIARDLHDGAVQSLTLAAKSLGTLEPHLGACSKSASDALADSMALVQATLQEVRTLSYLLHPPILQVIGLTGALRDFATGFARRSGIKIDLTHLQSIARLPADSESALLRVAQESLTNIHRHSGSQSAEVILEQDSNQVVLEVVDHGTGIAGEILRGLDDSSGPLGVGLAGMRERIRQIGGKLRIESHPGRTSIRAIVQREGWA